MSGQPCMNLVNNLKFNIMKNIAILILKHRIKLAKKEQQRLSEKREAGYSIIYGAYSNMIKNYEDSIMFLKAEQHK